MKKMDKRLSKKATYILLGGIALIALYLRILGISWGLPNNSIHHFPFHCDEASQMYFISQLDFKKGNFFPIAAHEEGTLSVYFWMIQSYLFKMVKIIPLLAHQLQGAFNSDLKSYIVASRLSVVFFDLISLFLIFRVTLRLSYGSYLVALFGALMWAILPAEILHSHYMRAHILGNTFILLILYFTLYLGDELLIRIRNKRSYFLYILLGILCGLATANRYTFLITLIIPCSYFLFLTIKNKIFSRFPILFFLLLSGTILGLFIGDPYLFLKFAEVKGPMLYQYSYKLPSSNFFDMARPWWYLSKVIPQMTIGLWPLFYLSLIFGFFLLKKQRLFYFISLFFILFYFFVTTKNYPLYAFRLILPIFPFMIILSALSIGSLWEKLSLKKNYILTLTVGSFLIITTLFSYKVSRALETREADPYIELVNYFKGIRTEGEGPKSFGFISKGWDWYHTSNFSLLLESVPLTLSTISDSKVDYLDPSNSRDYIILFHTDLHDGKKEFIDLELERLISSKKYVLLKKFHHDIFLFPKIVFNYDNYPTDFLYPFPTIYLLRKLNG